MSQEMSAEFDTVAAWTAEVALDLGPEHRVPAACRGSGSPGAMRWLVDQLELGPGDWLLDCGAGVGGPAAFAAAEVGAAPVLTEPEGGACRAARQLFDLPVLQAASALPFADGSFDVAWSLGVLCTVGDQPGLLTELRRVLRPGGRLGLLVFVSRADTVSDPPAGNDFPREDRLRAMLDAAGFAVTNSASSADFAAAPEHWQQRAEAVEAELERRHHDDPVWRTAERQSGLIGGVLARGEVAGMLLVARAR